MIDHTHLRLFQFCDPQFPADAFGHSFGFETYIQRSIIYDDHIFIVWLKMFLQEQLTYSDGLAMRLVYDTLENDDIQKVLHIDKPMFVQNLPKETRTGAKQMGTHMVKLVLELYNSPWIARYHQQIQDKKVKLNPTIYFTVLGHYLGVGIETIVDHYLYQNVSNLTQNAVRAILFGRTAGQKIVTHTIPYIEEIRKQIFEPKEADSDMITPGLELNQMAHKSVNVRVFIS